MPSPQYNLTITQPITYVSGITHAEIANSGFVKNSDLISSGYVRKINNLSNTPTIVGSGSVQVWVDGTTIQIGTNAGAGTPEGDQYPVDARAVSGNIAPSTSGSFNLGSSTRFFHQLWVNSGIFQSGVSVSGTEVIYKINNIGGPNININAGLGVSSIAQQDHTLYINVSGDATYNSLHQSGYIRNSDFIQSGFITKTEVASSGFSTKSELITSGYVRHADMLVSGFAKLSDLLGSGFKPQSQIDHGTITGLLDNDHPQYILNSAFVGSGFITKAEVASSGFATGNSVNTVSGKYCLNLTKDNNNITSYSNFSVGGSTSGGLPRMRATEPSTPAAYAGKIIFGMPPTYVSGQNFNAEINLQASNILDISAFFQLKIFEVPSGTGAIGTTNLIENDGISQYTLNGQSLIFFNGIASGLSPQSQLIIEYFLHWPNGSMGSTSFIDVKTIALHLPIYGVRQ